MNSPCHFYRKKYVPLYTCLKIMSMPKKKFRLLFYYKIKVIDGVEKVYLFAVSDSSLLSAPLITP